MSALGTTQEVSEDVQQTKAPETQANLAATRSDRSVAATTKGRELVASSPSAVRSSSLQHIDFHGSSQDNGDNIRGSTSESFDQGREDEAFSTLCETNGGPFESLANDIVALTAQSQGQYQDEDIGADAWRCFQGHTGQMRSTIGSISTDNQQNLIPSPHILGSQMSLKMRIRCEQPIFILRPLRYTADDETTSKDNERKVPTSKTEKLGIDDAVKAKITAELLSTFRQQTRKMFVEGIVPVLADQLSATARIPRAALCHKSVVQVNSLPGDSGFNLYHCAQMLVSFLLGSGHETDFNFRSLVENEKFEEHNSDVPPVPSIIELQKHFEDGYQRLIRYKAGPEVPINILVLPLLGTCERFNIHGTQKPLTLFHV
ncbi:Hypothetical protein D9617_13g100900 [Elsinoe fawcettii]|nr:Hypothetical protein D9617_13g100900 [Elsinoe fawcettii]